MASKKRVESKKQAGQAGQVTINTSIDDAQKSIDHLISEGLRKHKEGHLYNKYKSNKQLPPNFYAKPPPKSRGSSVGHSRESSDDGFSGSGRQTLSPSSISPNTVAGFHPYSNPNPGVVHQRQASAPALINYGVGIDQQHTQQQPSASNRGMPGLPPVTHGSLNTVATPPTMGGLPAGGSAFNISAPIQSPDMGTVPVYHDRESKSLDFDAMNHNMAVKAEIFDPISGNGAEYGDNSQPGYYDATRYWPEPRHKSLSLDPMTLAHMNTNHTSPGAVHQPIASPLPGTSDDLPEGWVQGYDANGEPYFIDHNNRRTTWFDPRMSEEMQQKAIKNRHQFSFSTGQIHQQRHIPPQLPQPPPPQQQQQQPQPQYYHHHQHSQPQTTFHAVENQFTHSQNPSLGGGSRDNRGDMVNELAMERNYMLERRQQLYRDGLIADGQHPPVPRQQQQPQYIQQNYPQQVYQQPESMEVDYTGAMPPTMQHASIDPAFVQDLNPNDLNPHEFDRYLCIDNNKRPSHNLHSGLPKYPRNGFS
uniref:WW domain-containing protein n=1 Tax=Panagrellus redivivus TaxID=6233 RepID=A0A7E4WB80_PANRE